MKKVNIMDFLINEGNHNILMFIRGHLYIEFAMNDIINKAFKAPKKLNRIANTFYNKIVLLSSVGRIDTQLESLLKDINSHRNKFAHNLDYDIIFDDVFRLAGLAAAARIDFTDDNIHLDYKFSKDNYRIEDILSELYYGLFYRIFEVNNDLYPHDEFMDYLI